jgi:hypothetical protein
MTVSNSCEQCGAELAEAKAGALCAACLATGTTIDSPADDITHEHKPAARSDGSILGWIGRFELRAVLGEGGFGRVYLAHDSQLDRAVALKVPHFAFDGGSGGRDEERFLTEARAAARLRHANIVPVYECGRAGPRLYIASELVEGESLADRLRRARPDCRLSASWILDLARALAYAHGEGIIHRDIKPGNLLIGKDGRIRITDFGLAKRLDDQAGRTIEGMVLGTPAYMSPEQARGELAAVGPASDQYCLGAVLYELLTGNRPFAGSVEEVLSKAIVDEPAPPRKRNPAVPRDLEAICLKAMAKQPSHRYAGADKLADDLSRFLAGEIVVARSPGAFLRAIRWCRRRPLHAALAAMLMLLIVAAGAWSWREVVISKEEKFAAHRDAARALARRGDWRESLEYYDQAIAEADSERLPLAVERVRVLFPLGQRDQIREDLSRLSAEPNLGDQAAAVLLMRADLMAGETANAQAVRELVGEALGLGLSKADEAYAKALLAHSASEAAALLDQSLQADPLHHRASGLAILALAECWRFDDAQFQLLQHRRFFPDDPAGPFFEAWVKTFVEDKAGARAAIEEVTTTFKAHFTPDQRQDLGDYVRMHEDLLHAMNELRPFGQDNAAGALQPSANMLGVTAKMTAMRERFGEQPLFGHFGLSIPSVPWHSSYWSAINLVLGDMRAGRSEQAVARLDRLIDRQPDAYALMLRAYCKVIGARKLQSDVDAFMARIASAAEDAHLGAKSPTPASQIRRNTFLLAFMLDAFHLNVMNEPQAWLSDRLKEGQLRLLAEMQLQVDEHVRFTEILATQMHHLDPAVIIPLLVDWRAKDPANPRPVGLHAEWELRARNFTAALELADLVLKESPQDLRMKKVRSDAQEELRKMLESQ